MYLAPNKDAEAGTLSQEGAPKAPRPFDVFTSWARNPKIALLRRPGQVATLPVAPLRSATMLVKERHGKPTKGHILRLQAKGKCRFDIPFLPNSPEQEVQNLIDLVKNGRADWVSGTQFGNLCFERKSLRTALILLDYMKD